MMKVITLWNPWAMFIPWGEKEHETRSWFTTYRGPLLIHASKNIPAWVQPLCYEEPFFTVLKQHNETPFLKVLPAGQIVGICNLVDCIEITPKFIDGLSNQELAFGDYTPGRYGWILDNVHQLKAPIPAKGRQHIWNWDETPHLVSIDPYQMGDTKIWTPKGVMSGRKLDRPDEDTVFGLEVA